MCSIPLEPDNRTYFIVSHLSPAPQLYSMSIVNLSSIFINGIMFYVTISKSKNESTIYKCASFVHNFSLFLSQFYWGTILNPIPLLPLPGVISIGLLSPYTSTFILLVVWILVFAFSIIMMYMILLIRLRVLARKDSIFYFRDSTYLLIFFFLCLSIIIPTLSRVTPYFASDNEMRRHVDRYYPNCVPLTEFKGFFVFVNTCKSTKGVFVVLGSLFGGATIYLMVCGVIIYEIRMQSTRWNVHRTRNHIKVLKDTIVQNIFRLIFLAVAPTIVLRNAFQSPDTDTIAITLLANTIFVAAPIPCALVIMLQNVHYREFLLEKFKICQRKPPGSTTNSESTVTRRSTTLL